MARIRNPRGPAVDTDPYYMSAEEEAELIEQRANEEDAFREAVREAIKDYRGNLLDKDDVRRIVTEELNRFAGVSNDTRPQCSNCHDRITDRSRAEVTPSMQWLCEPCARASAALTWEAN